MVNRTHLFLLPQATRNPSPKQTDLSLQDVGLMAARHTQLGPNRPLRAQKGKRPQTAGLALRVPRPEEEDPRVSVEAGMGFEAGALPGVLRQARLPEDHGPDSVVQCDMGRKCPRLHIGTLRGSEHQPQGTIRSDSAFRLRFPNLNLNDASTCLQPDTSNAFSLPLSSPPLSMGCGGSILRSSLCWHLTSQIGCPLSSTHVPHPEDGLPLVCLAGSLAFEWMH